MTADDLTTRVLGVLVRIAPELDPGSVRPDASLRDEYDLDSMDFLNFVIRLHEEFAIDIPEADYPRLATLAGCVRYLRERGGRPSEHASPDTRPTHRFEGLLSWERAAEGVTASNHTLSFAARPPLPMSAPPQYHGDGTRLSPEELFVGSVASCQLLTYLALAARAGVVVVRYEDRPVGTLAAVQHRMRVTEVCLRPRITVVPGSDTAKARSLVDAAHDACFVANSITATVRIEPDILQE